MSLSVPPSARRAAFSARSSGRERRVSPNRLSRLFRLGLVERRSQSLRQCHRVVVRPEVHEVDARLFVEEMTVQRRHGDPMIAQRANNWIHFAAPENEITSDGCLSVAGWLEVDCGRDSQRHRNDMPGFANRLAAWDGD